MRVLYIESTFPALTHTFIFREIRRLREIGLQVNIGVLRPLRRTPAARGFDDLRPLVSGGRWLSLDLLAGAIFFSLRCPRLCLRHLKTIFRSGCRPKDLARMCYLLLAATMLAYRFRSTGIQRVHAHFLNNEALAARFVSDFLGIPYSLSIHTPTFGFTRPAMEEVVRGATLLVSDTCEAKSILLTLGVDPALIRVIRNGVRMDEFAFRERQESSDPPIVLGVGRLDLRKGFHVLLQACRILTDRGTAFRCVVIGDGEERMRLTEMRRELGLDQRVEMLGNLGFKDLQQWYGDATLLVVPSVLCPEGHPQGQMDGLPTVVIEALASGLPVVGARTAAIPEAIEDGITGLLVAPYAPEDLADKIERVLKDSHLRHSLARQGRFLAERVFNLSLNVGVLADLMRDQATEK